MSIGQVFIFPRPGKALLLEEDMEDSSFRLICYGYFEEQAYRWSTPEEPHGRSLDLDYGLRFTTVHPGFFKQVEEVLEKCRTTDCLRCHGVLCREDR
jgi:hypothetical protein